MLYLWIKSKFILFILSSKLTFFSVLTLLSLPLYIRWWCTLNVCIEYSIIKSKVIFPQNLCSLFYLIKEYLAVKVFWKSVYVHIIPITFTFICTISPAVHWPIMPWIIFYWSSVMWIVHTFWAISWDINMKNWIKMVVFNECLIPAN